MKKFLQLALIIFMIFPQKARPAQNLHFNLITATTPEVAKQTACLIYTLTRYAEIPTHLHILMPPDNILSDEIQQRLLSLQTSQNCISFLQIPQDTWEHCLECREHSKPYHPLIFSQLALPTLLKTEDFCVWLDSDTMVIQSLQPFKIIKENMKRRNFLFGGCDYTILERPDRVVKDLNKDTQIRNHIMNPSKTIKNPLDDDHQTRIDGGVVFMNLKEIRRQQQDLFQCYWRIVEKENHSILISFDIKNIGEYTKWNTHTRYTYRDIEQINAEEIGYELYINETYGYCDVAFKEQKHYLSLKNYLESKKIPFDITPPFITQEEVYTHFPTEFLSEHFNYLFSQRYCIAREILCKNSSQYKDYANKDYQKLIIMHFTGNGKTIYNLNFSWWSEDYLPYRRKEVHSVVSFIQDLWI